MPRERARAFDRDLCIKLFIAPFKNQVKKFTTTWTATSKGIKKLWYSHEITHKNYALGKFYNMGTVSQYNIKWLRVEYKMYLQYEPKFIKIARAPHTHTP